MNTKGNRGIFALLFIMLGLLISSAASAYTYRTYHSGYHGYKGGYYGGVYRNGYNPYGWNRSGYRNSRWTGGVVVGVPSGYYFRPVCRWYRDCNRYRCVQIRKCN